MKYFVIGFNASGKSQIAKDLKSLGVKVGDIFRSIQSVPETTYSLSNIVYSIEDIELMFENKSYIFVKDNKVGSESFIEGLSFYDYDNNDVFFITPEHFNLIPKFDQDVVFIWLDNNSQQRRIRFLTERRKYNFAYQESIEQQDIQDFVGRINNNSYIYFFNEEPGRVSAIIYSLINHPELLNIYKNRFN